MKSNDKTREQLLKDIDILKAKIAELEKSETKCKKVIERIEENERELNAIFNGIKTGMVILDKTGKIIRINKYLIDVGGFHEKVFLGKRFKILKMFTPKSIRKMIIGFSNVLKGKDIPPYEVVAYTKKGEKKSVQIYNSILKKEGKVEGVIVILNDITEKKQAEINLRESEEKYRTLTENLSVGIFRSTVGPKGKFIEVNFAFLKIFGYRSKEEIFKISASDLYINPQDRRELNEILLKNGSLKNEVLNLKKKDGTNFIALVNSNAVKNEKGEVVYFDGVIKDITERKNAERKIRESEEKLRNFMNTTTIGIWCFRPKSPVDITKPVEKQIDEFMKSTCIECNETYAAMLGTTRDSIIGITLSEVLPDSEETKEYFREFIKGGYKLDGGETHEISKTGEEKYFSNSFIATIKNNMLLQAWGTQTDITERKRAEQTQTALYNITKKCNTTKTLNELYKTVHIQLGKVINTKNFYIALYDKENDTILFPYHIDEKSQFTSYPARKTLTAYVLRTCKPLLGTEEVIGQLIEAGEVGKGKKGTRCKIWLGVPLIVDNVAIGVLAVQSYTDPSIYSEKDLEILEFVSEEIALTIKNIQAEETLQESERKYRFLFNNLLEGVLIIDAETMKIVLANRAVAEIYGFDSEDDIIGLNPLEFIPTDEKERVYRIIVEDMFEKDLQQINEFRTLTKSSKEIWISAIGLRTEYLGRLSGLISIREITEQKRSEQIQSVLNNIAKAVSKTKNLDDFYRTIHYLLNIFIEVKNFYIALYDEDKNTIYFPYYVDEKDVKPEPVPQKLSKGLTDYVIRTGKSLFAPKEYYMKLVDEGKIEITGSISEVWIGIPLRIENRIIGVMAIQSYKDDSVYNKKDLEILELISYEIAIAIKHKKMEDINLRLSESIRNARDGIILTNPDGQITYVNPAYEKMSGYTLSELLYKDPASFIVTEDTAVIANEIRSSVKILGEWKGELYCIRKNEEVYPIYTRVFAIKNEKGQLIEIAAIQQDITERKQAEESLNKELSKRKILQDVALSLLEMDLEKSIKTALNAIRIGLDLPEVMLRIRVDPNNDLQIADCRENLSGIESILPVNKRGEETILAYEKKEISVVNDIRKKHWYERHKDIWEKTNILSYLSIPCINHSGDVKGILYLYDERVRIWSDDEKNLGKAVAAELASVIDRKHADEALKESEERFLQVAENAQEWIWEVDTNGLYTYVSPIVEKILGYKPEELVGKKHFYDLFHPEDRKKIKDAAFEVFEKKLSFREFLNRNINKAGKEVLLSTSGMPILDKKGVLLGYRGADTDITERQQVEKEIQDKSAELKKQLEKSEKQRIANLVVLNDLNKTTEDLKVEIIQRQHAENIQKTLYNISNAVNTTDKLPELYNKIKTILGEIIDTTNFIVTLYDEKTESISLPLLVDKKDKFETFPAGKTLVKYVIKTGKPLFATNDVVKELTKKGVIETIGTPSKTWLGVPLKIENKIIGVIVVQSYDDPNLYTEKDIEILTFVSDEIAIAIQHMQAEELLLKSEEKYRSLVETIEEGIVNVDENETFVFVNQAAADIFGYSKDEMIGKNLEELTSPEMFQKLLEETSTRKKGESSYYELQILRKDREQRIITVTSTPNVSKNGEFQGSFGIYHDITKRKKAQEQIKKDLKVKEVMLREIHHRVKNNLQVIISLLNLQSQRINDDKVREIFDISKARIRSMALVHEKLYGSENLDSINFDEYIRSLTRHMLGIVGEIAYYVKVDIDVKDVVLDINKAIPCGLIINELVSNAFKHAFPDYMDKPEGRKGNINISMYKDKQGKYNLIVQDNGIGLPKDFNIKNIKSLGMILITSLTEQINGNIEVIRDKGTTFFKIAF